MGWGESTSLQGGLGQETIPEGWKDNKEFSGTGEQDINITCSRMKQVTLPLRWKVDNITATEGIQLKESSDGIGDEDKESEGKGIMEEQPRLESTMDVENIGVDKDDVPRGWIRTLNILFLNCITVHNTKFRIFLKGQMATWPHFKWDVLKIITCCLDILSQGLVSFILVSLGLG